MTKTSPFYQEIIALLQAKVRHRADDLSASAQLALAEAGALDPSSLSFILEGYQQSSQQKQFTQVEGAWMNSFSEAEFEALGLKKYFPRIYRGLPRLYHRDNPSRSKIKQNFTDLGRLKNLSVERALFSLYDGFVPKVGTKVGIVSWVLSDGLGDFMAAQETARILHERFPSLEIQLFAITKRSFLPSADFQTRLIQYEGAEKEVIFDADFGMDLLIQIPTYFPNSETLFASQTIECIGEYGFLDSSWFHPNSRNRSMGLHALEKGIFIRKHHVVTFAELENKALLLALFGVELPGPIEVDLYLQKTQFHLAYLATTTGGSIYLHSLLKMWERDAKNIDVCSPDISWLIQWLDQRQQAGLPLLEDNYGVKELVIEWDGKIHRAHVAEKGKVLRVICPGVVSFADMQRLICLSGDWVGVRGNQSLSEALSSGKAFFYDGRDHSRYLMKDLLAMAENRLSGYKQAVHAFRLLGQAFLWNLPEDLELWVDDTHFQQEGKLDPFLISKELGACLQDPDAIAGFKKLGLICAEERSFAPFVCNLVQRSLLHKQNSKLKFSEESLTELYGKGEISFSYLVEKLRNECGSSST